MNPLVGGGVVRLEENKITQSRIEKTGTIFFMTYGLTPSLALRRGKIFGAEISA